MALAVVVHKHPGDSVPPSWAQLLKKMEARVTSAEGDGLRARWEFGKELLLQRKGKQLPAGLLDNVAAAVGVSRRELQARVKFAEKFPAEPALRDAITQWPTWVQMTHEGIPTHREAPKPKASAARLAMRHAAALMADVHAVDLEDADLRAIDTLIAELTRIKAEQEGTK